MAIPAMHPSGKCKSAPGRFVLESGSFYKKPFLSIINQISTGNYCLKNVKQLAVVKTNAR